MSEIILDTKTATLEELLSTFSLLEEEIERRRNANKKDAA